MNQTIPQIALTFDLPLHRADIPAFRGAFARLAGQRRGHDLFHNHNNDPRQRADFHHRYPLVQYRTRGPHAAVLGLGAGARELADLCAGGTLDRFSIRGHRIPLRVIDRQQRPALELDTAPEGRPFAYRLARYLPFSQARYEEYSSLGGLAERAALLERLLVNHLVSFSYAVGWTPPPSPRISVQLVDVQRQHRCHVLGRQPYLGFDLSFRTNLHLPTGIGLGRKTAFGYGVVENFK